MYRSLLLFFAAFSTVFTLARSVPGAKTNSIKHYTLPIPPSEPTSGLTSRDLTSFQAQVAAIQDALLNAAPSALSLQTINENCDEECDGTAAGCPCQGTLTPLANASSPTNSATSIETAPSSNTVTAPQTLTTLPTTNSSTNTSFVSTSTQTVFSTTFSHITITLETETTSQTHTSPANRIRVPAIFAIPRLAMKALAAITVFNLPGAAARIHRARRGLELRAYEQAAIARVQSAGSGYALKVRGTAPGEKQEVNDTLSANWNGTTGNGRLTCTGQVTGGDVGFNCEKSAAISSMSVPRIFKLPALLVGFVAHATTAAAEHVRQVDTNRFLSRSLCFQRGFKLPILLGNLISRIPYSLAAAARLSPPLSSSQSLSPSSSPSSSSFPPQSANEVEVRDATKTAGGDAGTQVQNIAARATTCVTEPLGSLPGAPFCYDNNDSDEGESAGARSLSIPRIFKLPVLLMNIVANIPGSLTQRIVSTDDKHGRAVGNGIQRVKGRECYGDPEGALGFTCSAGTRTTIVPGLFKLPVVLTNFINHLSSLAERISLLLPALALPDNANTNINST